MLIICFVEAHINRSDIVRRIANKPGSAISAGDIIAIVLLCTGLTGKRITEAGIFTRSFLDNILQHFSHIISSLRTDNLRLLFLLFHNNGTVTCGYAFNDMGFIHFAFIGECRVCLRHLDR